MITTRGFRDVIEIGRQTRPAIYDLWKDQPAPLVPGRRRFELAERIMADGRELVPIDPADLERVIAELRASGASAVAVCLLFSYLRPDHERAVGEALRRALPGVAISLSSSVQPEFREFERFTTTVVNAYLQPVLDAYIASLRARVAEVVPDAVVGINQSSGGLMSLETARAFPVRMALSGPAAGVVAVCEILRRAERPDAITLDIGGTSADVALIQDCTAELTHGRDVDGFPIRLPMIDITTVGAGGGSIAWFDVDGLFKAGPQSAGAVPGPACYSRGGTLPTVSDANLVLGRLPETLLNGAMTLDRARATAALHSVADPMGKSLEETALGLLEIMTGNMVRAIRNVSVERGHDPRRFTLVAFGGAGGLHAREVAAALGMAEVLVPLAPGIVCAQGLTDAELQESFVLSRVFPATDDTGPALRDCLAGLGREARAWFEAERAPSAARRVSYWLDMRFFGQNFELTVEAGEGDETGEGIAPLSTILERFYAAHERSYGFADHAAPVEIVNCRATAHAALGAPRPTPGEAAAERRPASQGSRRVCFALDAIRETPAFRRETLRTGDVIAGPAVIDQMDATTVIFPGDVVRVDAFGNLLVKIGASHE